MFIYAFGSKLADAKTMALYCFYSYRELGPIFDLSLGSEVENRLYPVHFSAPWKINVKFFF